MTNLDPTSSGAPAAVSSGRSYTCSWCGQASDGASLSCPACGAKVDVRAVVSNSGWSKLPGRRDMAKLQFGNSYCQVEGTYVPVADMNLAAGDWVYFSHHVLLWMDTQVKVTAMPMKGAWKRMLAGMPLIMTQAQGPGHIAFSRDTPGEMISLPLQPGQAVDVREHLFMVATGAVTYDWFPSNVWFSTREGDETETHYPLGLLLDRFQAAAAPGLLLLHAAGNVFVRNLAAGETILVKPTAFLFKDTTVRMQLHIEKPAGTWRSWRSWGDRYLWLRLHGPGRVAVQSAFEPLEDNGRTMVDHSGATQRQW
jgi:uncharacterized protein (AIM24 family)/DNA-directed RNA polymerase subunit RPC12/RpoP